ncbi:hypothetical protein H6503_04820 [Candidatus Woesearchaeota archaeon]|nr:hypothetical protein [Candidatus Woesearchaeota archaeon]
MQDYDEFMDEVDDSENNTEENREELLEEDEISSREEAFLKGYEDAAEGENEDSKEEE